MSSYEIISIIISSVSSLSIVIMAVSLIINIHNSIQLRKSKAAEAVSYYIQSTSDITSSSVAIVSSFSNTQCNSLYRQKELCVNDDELKKICNICPHNALCRQKNNQKLCIKKDDGFLLQEDISFMLRNNVLRYLNNLECVLLYWELGVVDQKTIEKEMSFLKYKNDVYKGLEIMRNLSGGAEAYPALDKYLMVFEKT